MKLQSECSLIGHAGKNKTVFKEVDHGKDGCIRLI